MQGIIWGEPDLAVTRRDSKLQHYFAEAWHKFDSNGVKLMPAVEECCDSLCHFGLILNHRSSQVIPHLL